MGLSPYRCVREIDLGYGPIARRPAGFTGRSPGVPPGLVRVDRQSRAGRPVDRGMDESSVCLRQELTIASESYNALTNLPNACQIDQRPAGEAAPAGAQPRCAGRGAVIRHRVSHGTTSILTRSTPSRHQSSASLPAGAKPCPAGAPSAGPTTTDSGAVSAAN